VTWFWAIAPLLCAAIYCIARAIVDVRQRRWWWALAGFVSAAIILATPIPTHAVKVNLPVSNAH
jgi:hypothetical protein